MGPPLTPADPAGPSHRRPSDGRVLVFAVIAFYFAVVATCRWALHFDIWPYLGVPSGPSVFYDARNVAAAADCQRLGHDPLVDNPCDPSGRPMNYPRVWLLLRFAGLRQADTFVFAVLMIVLFLAAVWHLLGRIPVRQAPVVAAALVSPAVMLAVERANVDLVLFSVMVLAVAAWRERRRLTSLPSVGLVLAAAMAKYYALLALPGFLLTRERRMRWAVPGALALFALYAALTVGDIEKVSRAPEGGLLFSFGARILLGYLYHLVVPDTWQGSNVVAQAIAIVPLVVLGAMAWVWARRRLVGVLEVGDGAGANLLAFYLGALVYLGTFATRKNGDYRLVFLLLTLPQLLAWSSQRTRAVAVARGGLVAVVVSLWVGALSRYIGPADELASWAVALLLVALLAGSVPPLRPARAPAGASARTTESDGESRRPWTSWLH